MKEFTVEGSWWLPETPEARVPGALGFSPDSGASLDLLGSLKDPGDHFAAFGRELVEAGIVNPSNLRQRSFKLLLETAGLPDASFHDLRHTCASLLFQRNVHPKFVQELMGHASVAVTLDTYSHMLPGMGGEAADAISEALA